ncbi:hypothetical protein HOG17_01650 [Candidatus Peregrinibacteria bacterium]|nr:hypothetical protein [Candidatus Peregrinibacteria bacterium]MBT4148437.1 hypothetical protein [Candidatus Peregrinibacteria bacterium]MBT4366134.1 hypothetical protein [Candidatus Peregrinibacteria bacterium]MBT4456583.1 hypothetical protein [Candidatus Peregrinibacteria bacterium]
MEIRITKRPGELNILSKITYILGGILLASSTLSITLHFLGSIGLGLGFAILIFACYLGFKKTKPHVRLRLITWGILGTSIFSLIAAVAFYFALSNAVS